MRKTVWDDFIFYEPKQNKIILRTRDVAWDGVWSYFNFDGKKAFWDKGKPKKNLVLIDRLPEKTL